MRKNVIRQDESYHDRWITKVCEQLNKLILLDFDAAGTYREALVHIEDPGARSDLHAFLGDHERHVLELTQVVRDLGRMPVEAHRDVKGMILEGMTKLRSRSTLGALRAMRMNEWLTNRIYDRSAEFFMPPIGQAIVLENLADERRHLAAIESHISRLSGRHYYDVNRVDREASERPFLH